MVALVVSYLILRTTLSMRLVPLGLIVGDLTMAGYVVRRVLTLTGASFRESAPSLSIAVKALRLLGQRMRPTGHA